MKKIILSMFQALSTLFNGNTKTTEAVLEKAGILPNLIPDENNQNINKLKISGELNGTDIKYIREMIHLSHLDISEAKIVEQGDVYYNSDYSSYTTAENTIGSHMFYELKNLVSVALPNNITTIEEWAFFQCTGLTSVTIPNSVTSIEVSAFSNCNGLTHLTIGCGIKEIYYAAFYRCNSLKEIHIKAKKPPVVYCAFFKEDIVNCVLYVPKGTLNLYKNSDEWKYFKHIIEE